MTSRNVKSGTGRLAALIAGISVVLVLAFASTATAQDSRHGGNPAGRMDSVSRSSIDATLKADPGALPFTGLDVALAVGGALVLLGTGAVTARLSSRDSV